MPDNPSPPSSPSFPGGMPEKDRVIGVGDLNRVARQLLESHLPLLWVAGEISGLTRAVSGHLYFTLKDAAAQVRCTLWRNKAQLLGFLPENGQKVEVRALATLYEARGEYQLNVETLRRAGQGALFERFLALKARLEAEGLFRPEGKRPLPPFPRRLAIVTSPQAAALRDVLTTLRRRSPHVALTLFPTPVQGEGAARQIAAALEAAADSGCDAIILCRGGGSLEDLWAFNEAEVVYAIRASRVPVVSGIGHETDFTLADFAADLRAPTPTSAAEQIAPDRAALLYRLSTLVRRLRHNQQNRLAQWTQCLDHLAARLPSPARQLAARRERLDMLAASLRGRGGEFLENRRRRLEQLRHRLSRQRPALAAQREALNLGALRLAHARRESLRQKQTRLGEAARSLAQLDPRAVLARGYAIALDAQGHAARDALALKTGEALTLILAQGEAGVVVRGAGDRSQRTEDRAAVIPDPDSDCASI